MNRGGPKAAPDVVPTTQPIVSQPEPISTQIRRRIDASRRLQPLADCRRDPIAKPITWSNIQVRTIGRNTIEFSGCDRAVYRAITTVGARHQRAVTGGAWLVQQVAADDVMALLESRGYRLEVTF